MGHKKSSGNFSPHDSLLTINDRDILTHAGKISHELALIHAEQHYETFHHQRLAEAAEQPDDFAKATQQFPAPIPRKKTHRKS